MNRLLIAATIGILAIVNLHAHINDLTPDASLWTTKDGISLQAVCYNDLGSLGVTEPNAKAVVRVYLLNGRDHTVYHIGSEIDDGFLISGTNAAGQSVNLRSGFAMSARRIELKAKTPRAYNIILGSNDLTFLKNQQLTVSAKIGDKTTGQIMVIQAPIELK